jgi:glycerol-3-phosphate acyltransferase PlsY
MELTLLLAYAYLVGSVPTAYIIAKVVRGIDIRRFGSGNVGGSNLARHVGKRWVVPLGLFEIGVKGASPTLLGHYAFGYEISSWPLVTAALLAVAGHNWPVWLKFTGGRGVAVALGVFLALSPTMLLVFGVLTCVGWLVFRNTALWTAVALVVMPVANILLDGPAEITGLTAALAVIMAVKRLLGNGAPESDEPLPRVLLYRLLYDRDVRDYREWVTRTPMKAHGDRSS